MKIYDYYLSACASLNLIKVLEGSGKRREKGNRPHAVCKHFHTLPLKTRALQASQSGDRLSGIPGCGLAKGGKARSFKSLFYAAFKTGVGGPLALF